ncbi:MAG: hypothetical protein ACI4EU_01030 [Butyrivibrio sp.]
MCEEFSEVYDVHMKTSIGVRSGQMTVYQSLGKVHGSLDILNHCEPFEGIINSDGSCILHGKIITLIKTINYMATGEITPQNLTLSIADSRYLLEITGTPHKS